MPPSTSQADQPLDAIERRQLCDLFEDLGPDKPTLCGDWNTLHLAAHLVVREHDPRAGLVILGGSRFSSLEDKLMSRAANRGLDTLFGRLRTGPPLIPWRLPGLRTTLNLNEWFVHHEDVRRANGLGPREISAELDAALWEQLGRAARFLVRGAKGLALQARTPDGRERRLKKGKPAGPERGSLEVVLSGPAQELVLYVNGRRDHAEVEIEGSDAAREALDDARLGL